MLSLGWKSNGCWVCTFISVVARAFSRCQSRPLFQVLPTLAIRAIRLAAFGPKMPQADIW